MLDTSKFVPEIVLRDLLDTGAASFPILYDSARDELLKEALAYHYENRSGIVGKAGVSQEFAAFNAFPPGSAFYALRWYFTKSICGALAKMPGMSFDPAIRFNEIVLQRYPASSSGISPHIDSKRCRNLVAVFPLWGDGDFALCNDRTGKNAMVIHAPPGHVILMAAIGLHGRDVQQFHFLNNIDEGRITFGMRHLDPPGTLG